MNLRPSGYEPDELPGCSTPRRVMVVAAVLAAAAEVVAAIAAGTVRPIWAAARAPSPSGNVGLLVSARLETKKDKVRSSIIFLSCALCHAGAGL